MLSGGSVHLESQYDSQVSTVSNTPDTSHTDHITDFNNKKKSISIVTSKLLFSNLIFQRFGLNVRQICYYST